jgi:hypothetical protein
MKTFNLLNLLRTKYIQVFKMVPLSNKIGASFALPLRVNSYLSMGRRTGLVTRVNYTMKFVHTVISMWRQHGSAFTIQWLKCSSVALQKFLGNDRISSLRVLKDDLPMPRLRNGLPYYISIEDRRLIRANNVKIIRFHLGLLNLYRVLEAPGVLKLQTITEPFSGSKEYLDNLINLVKDKELIFFNLLPGFERVRAMDLSPKEFVQSRSASPSNSMAVCGIITDVMKLNIHRPDLWQDILDYLYLTKPKVTKFVRMLQHAYELGLKLSQPITFTGVKSGLRWTQHNPLRVKAALRAHGDGPGLGLSQFAVKYEAAGKIRLFALLDSITQSVMAPLHEAEFALLRMIPNDGTFDQEASIKRSQAKAMKSGKAFSYDLTAATDRLPAVLTAAIIEIIFSKIGLGGLWLSIMTNRVFGFNGAVAEKLGVDPSSSYKYEVGQPMGGLSSWPGLAITHHWIVQYAAYRAHLAKCYAPHHYKWCEEYEILGDDIVIFDANVAREYLVIMQGVGCEINLNKSINSPDRPVFEFAKRTCIGPDIVSGISLGQVKSGYTVGARVANALSFSNSGLIPNVSLLSTVLNRFAMVRTSQKEMGLPTLALLGSLFQAGKVTHRELAHAITEPSNEDFDYESDSVAVPIQASLKACLGLLNGESSLTTYPFSKESSRDEIFKEYRSEFSTVILQKALKIASNLYENSDALLARSAKELYFPVFADGKGLQEIELSDMSPDYSILVMQIENFYNMVIGQDDSKVTPEFLHDKIYDVLYKHAKYNHVKLEEALDLLDEVVNLEFKYKLEAPAKPGKTILETTPILSIMRNMVHFMKVKSIHKALDFAPSWYGPVG